MLLESHHLRGSCERRRLAWTSAIDPGTPRERSKTRDWRELIAKVVSIPTRGIDDMFSTHVL